MILVLVLVVSALLGGCGVSRDGYDKLAKEKSELSEKLKKQEDTNEKLSKVNKEYLDKIVENEYYLITPKTWAQYYFGQDCIVLANNSEYLQIISKQEYSLSADGVQTVWNKVLDSTKILDEFFDEVKFERIAMKFPQVGGSEMIEFVIKKKDETYEFESCSINAGNIRVLVPAVEQAFK